MKTVLIIEDDTALRENTAELLELQNFKVLTAPNGADGIRLATINIPDLIICDIMMPKQDGYSVLKKLAQNKETQHIPFIFLSAKTEHKEIRYGMNLGADDYITKPFEDEELISSINSRLAKAKILKKTNASLKQEKYKDLNDLKNYFNDYGELSTYAKGDVIYQAGDRANKIFLILNGLIKTHKMDQNGKELITAIQKPDDFLGLTSFTDNNIYQEYATVVEDAELAGIYKNTLREMLADSSNLSLELMNVLTENLSITKDQLLQMAYSSVQRKTARTILQFAAVLNRGPLGEIKISRNDLASVAGIAPESLIRTLSSFKKKGFVEIEGRNIKILKLEELQNLD